MYTIQDRLSKEIQEIKDSGLYKNERIITSPQAADITPVSYTHLTLPTSDLV